MLGPVLAEPAAPFSQVTHVTIGVFCVAGGVLIGWLAGGFLMRLLFPLKNRRAPGWFQKIGKVIGGIALGVAVYYMYFSGGKGGQGEGGGAPELSRDQKHKSEDAKAIGEMRITLLGGDATEGKFFLVDDQNTPMTFADLQTRVDQRRGDPTRPLQLVRVYVYSDSTAKEGTVGRELDQFLTQRGLPPKYEPVSDMKRPQKN